MKLKPAEVERFVTVLAKHVRRNHKTFKNMVPEFDPLNDHDPYNFCFGLLQCYATWSLRQHNEFITEVTGKEHTYATVETIKAYEHTKRLVHQKLGITETGNRYTLSPVTRKVLAANWPRIRRHFTENADMPLTKPRGKKRAATTEEAVEPTTTRKKRGSKKATSKKATSKKKVVASSPSTGERRVPPDLAGKKIISKENPAREGTVRRTLMTAIMRCKTAEGALGKTYTHNGEERTIIPIDIRVAEKIGAIELK